MVVLGDAATASSEIFDHFWNSELVFPADAFVKDPSWSAIDAGRAEELDRLRANADIAAFPIERSDWSDELASLVDRMSPGTATPEYDRLE